MALRLTRICRPFHLSTVKIFVALYWHFYLNTSRLYICVHLGNDRRSDASDGEELCLGELRSAPTYSETIASKPGKDSLGGRMCPLWWLSCVLDAVNPNDTATTRTPLAGFLSTASMQIFSCTAPTRYNSPLFADTVENQCSTYRMSLSLARRCTLYVLEVLFIDALKYSSFIYIYISR